MALRDKFEMLKDMILNCPEHGPELQPTMANIYVALEALTDYSGTYEDLDYVSIMFIDKLCHPLYEYKQMELFLNLLLKVLNQHVNKNLLHFIGEHVIVYLDNNIHDLKKEQLLMFYLRMLDIGKARNIDLRKIFPLSEMTLFKFLDHLQACHNKLKQKLELRVFHTLLPEIDNAIAESFFPGKRELQTALQTFRETPFDLGIIEFTNCLNSQGDEMFLLETIYVTIGSKQYGKDTLTERTYVEFNCTLRSLTIRILTQAMEMRPISIGIAQGDIELVLAKDFARIDVAEVLLHLKRPIDVKQLNHQRVKKIKLRFNTQYLKQVIFYQNDSFLGYFFGSLKDFRSDAEKFLPEFSDTSRLRTQTPSSVGKHVRSVVVTDTSSTLGRSHLQMCDHMSMPSSLSYTQFSPPPYCASSPTLRGSSKMVNDSFDSQEDSDQEQNHQHLSAGDRIRVLSNIPVAGEKTITYVRNTASSSAVSIITSGGLLTEHAQRNSMISEHSQDLFSYTFVSSDKENDDPNVQSQPSQLITNLTRDRNKTSQDSVVLKDRLKEKPETTEPDTTNTTNIYVSPNVPSEYYVSSTLPETMSAGGLFSSSTNIDSCFSPHRIIDKAGSFRSPLTLTSVQTINIDATSSLDQDMWMSPLPGDFSEAQTPATSPGVNLHQGTDETFYSVNSFMRPSSVEEHEQAKELYFSDRKRKLSDENAGDVVKKSKEVDQELIDTGSSSTPATIVPSVAIQEYFVPIAPMPSEQFCKPESTSSYYQRKCSFEFSQAKPIEELNNTYSTLNLVLSPPAVSSQNCVIVAPKEESPRPVTIVDCEDEAVAPTSPVTAQEEGQEEEVDIDLIHMITLINVGLQDNQSSAASFTLEAPDQSQGSGKTLELNTTPQFFKTQPLFASDSVRDDNTSGSAADYSQYEEASVSEQEKIQYFEYQLGLVEDNSAVFIKGVTNSEEFPVDVVNVSKKDMFEVVLSPRAESPLGPLVFNSEILTEDISMENVVFAIPSESGDSMFFETAPRLFEIATHGDSEEGVINVTKTDTEEMCASEYNDSDFATISNTTKELYQELESTSSIAPAAIFIPRESVSPQNVTPEAVPEWNLEQVFTNMSIQDGSNQVELSSELAANVIGKDNSKNLGSDLSDEMSEADSEPLKFSNMKLEQVCFVPLVPRFHTVVQVRPEENVQEASRNSSIGNISEANQTQNSVDAPDELNSGVGLEESMEEAITNMPSQKNATEVELRSEVATDIIVKDNAKNLGSVLSNEDMSEAESEPSKFSNMKPEQVCFVPSVPRFHTVVEVRPEENVQEASGNSSKENISEANQTQNSVDASDELNSGVGLEGSMEEAITNMPSQKVATQVELISEVATDIIVKDSAKNLGSVLPDEELSEAESQPSMFSNMNPEQVCFVPSVAQFHTVVEVRPEENVQEASGNSSKDNISEANQTQNSVDASDEELNSGGVGPEESMEEALTNMSIHEVANQVALTSEVLTNVIAKDNWNSSMSDIDAEEITSKQSDKAQNSNSSRKEISDGDQTQNSFISEQFKLNTQQLSNKFARIPNTPSLPVDEEDELVGSSTPIFRRDTLKGRKTTPKSSEHYSSELFPPAKLQMPTSSTPRPSRYPSYSDADSVDPHGNESEPSSIMACSNRATIGITTERTVSLPTDPNSYDLDPSRKQEAIKSMMRIRKYIARHTRPSRKTRNSKRLKELMKNQLMETLGETRKMKELLCEKLFD